MSVERRRKEEVGVRSRELASERSISDLSLSLSDSDSTERLSLAPLFCSPSLFVPTGGRRTGEGERGGPASGKRTEWEGGSTFWNGRTAFYRVSCRDGLTDNYAPSKREPYSRRWIQVDLSAQLNGNIADNNDRPLKLGISAQIESERHFRGVGHKGQKLD